MLVVSASASAANGLIAVELWSEDVCTGEVCSPDPVGVVLVQPDGGWTRRLPLHESYAPAFSPDGRLLAVNDDATYGIAVGYAYGSGFRHVYNHYSYTRLSTPDWSPTSTDLVFSSETEPYRSQLIRVSVQTGQRQTLGSGWGPVWSSDGRWIAFLDEKEDRSRVMIARPDGRGRRTLTSCDSAACGGLRWSYAGRSVVFADSRGEDDDSDGRDYAVNIATRKVTPIPSSGGDFNSPDWRLRATSGFDGVYVVRRDGSHRRRILGPPRQWSAYRYALGDWQRLP
jgi:Tol biopolymer transport system component